ncbi:VPLPA-CTERM sorting domain-containing protein [Boseongicola aestuarii]|uniref:VPLPA-CTERM protein sorting domain protein n=1 Tax=Boseongicola aestuarii TaxID=1470561 RepID=A0A238J3X2_9RHOB|nr:VPLPA-CTERM sorting domain-containing protein [Boseongicola aestuarii]SMX25439.1 hypothetical protein BOA8489_03582 [Boseongicola aestuarii]
MRVFSTICAAALVTIGAAAAANAATFKIDFDGASGDGGTVINEQGDKSYVVGGYIMEPVNIQGGLCADGKCTIETTQTVEPTLYREDQENFDLFSFYFLNTGNGAIGDEQEGSPTNFVTLDLYASFDDASPADGLSFFFGNLQTFADVREWGLDIVYFDGEGSDPGNEAECFEAIICKNYGYIISLNDLGLDIGKAVWSAAGDANARLDDLVVSQIPLPAAVWLLLGGLGGLAAMRRRRS